MLRAHGICRVTLRPKSLFARFILAWSGMTLCVVAVFGWFSYRGSREQLVRTWQQTLSHEGRLAVHRVQAVMDEAVRDAVYLSEKPAVREYSSAADEGSRELWRTLLEQDFRALLAGKPLYFQVRMIGTGDGGRELIRLDQADGQITPAARDKLQQKGDRDYFRDGVRLGPHQALLSGVNLNQEYGQVSEPHIPTARATVPVFRPDGQLFALTVVNLDLRPLLRELADRHARGVTLILANAAGDYLLHPEEEKTFGTDLGRPDRFLETEPLPAGTVPGLVWNTEFTAGTGLGPPLKLRAVCSSEEFSAGLASVRNRALGISFLAALGGAAVAAALGGWLARRLRALGEAMTRYEAGQEAPLADPVAEDEVGQLIGRFRHMASRVSEHVEKLAAARSEAEAATRAREDFLAMMSHEIRTPVNAIVGLLEALERNSPEARQRPILSSLQAASANLLSLVNQALDHSKIAAGRMEFDESDFSLRALVEDVALTHRPLAAAKGVALSATVDPDLPARLRGDAVRLAQILNNLVSNAVKFTDAGFIRIEAAAGPGPAGHPERIGLLLAVSDSGMGIAEDLVGKVFSPFEQSAVSRRFGGSGLGLSIVQQLVELQGGKLSVDSEPGRGSTFSIWLPVLPAGALETQPPAQARTSTLAGIRLLYVEDTASNVEVMRLALENTGAELLCAADAAAGLALLNEQGGFDLAMIDLQLPDMSGLDLARCIRSRADTPPLLAVTAQVAAETRAACASAGFAAVLAKPFSRAQLHAEIMRIVRPAATQPVPPVEGPTAGANGLPSAETASPRRLTDLFPGEPDRVARLVRTLSGEMEAHAAAVPAATAPELVRIRHKLHSMILQLGLHDLADALDAAIRSPDDPDARTRVLHALNAARAALQEESPALTR